MHLLPWLLAVTTIPATTGADVQSAACSYRVQIYAQFHTQRDDYDRHVEAANDVLDRWKKSGRGERDAKAVVDWFQAARQATLNGGQTPTLPTLEGANSRFDEIASQLTETPTEETNRGERAATELPGDSAEFDEPAFDEPAIGESTFDEFDNFDAEQDAGTEDAGTEDEQLDEGESSEGESAGAIDGIGRALRGLLAP